MIVRGEAPLPLRFTNASAALGTASVDHLPLSDHTPPLADVHEMPTGGVTRAQALSTRNSSICTFGTVVCALLPCRSTNPASDGTPLTVRSVPASGAAMIGGPPGIGVGAVAVPSAV